MQAPLLELEPWQVVDLGFQVAAPFEKTWSCTEDGRRALLGLPRLPRARGGVPAGGEAGPAAGGERAGRLMGPSTSDARSPRYARDA